VKKSGKIEENLAHKFVGMSVDSSHYIVRLQRQGGGKGAGASEEGVQAHKLLGRERGGEVARKNVKVGDSHRYAEKEERGNGKKVNPLRSPAKAGRENRWPGALVGLNRARW